MSEPIGLGVCQLCGGFTVCIRDCRECGLGFCGECLDAESLCPACKHQRFREDHDLDWDDRDEDRYGDDLP